MVIVQTKTELLILIPLKIRCFHCCDNHPSTSCSNYKECHVYKDLQRLRKLTSKNHCTCINNNNNNENNLNNVYSVDCKVTQL